MEIYEYDVKTGGPGKRLGRYDTFSEIKGASYPLMTAYQSDLELDRAWIERNPDLGFVHITREMGTHIFGLPTAKGIGADKPEPYLFGESYPSEIHRGILRLMKNHLVADSVLWAVCIDGAVFHCSAHAAIQVYENALEDALIAAREAY